MEYDRLELRGKNTEEAQVARTALASLSKAIEEAGRSSSSSVSLKGKYQKLSLDRLDMGLGVSALGAAGLSYALSGSAACASYALCATGMPFVMPVAVVGFSILGAKKIHDTFFAKPPKIKNDVNADMRRGQQQQHVDIQQSTPVSENAKTEHGKELRDAQLQMASQRDSVSVAGKGGEEAKKQYDKHSAENFDMRRRQQQQHEDAKLSILRNSEHAKKLQAARLQWLLKRDSEEEVQSIAKPNGNSSVLVAKKVHDTLPPKIKKPPLSSEDVRMASEVMQKWAKLNSTLTAGDSTLTAGEDLCYETIDQIADSLIRRIENGEDRVLEDLFFALDRSPPVIDALLQRKDRVKVVSRALQSSPVFWHFLMCKLLQKW